MKNGIVIPCYNEASRLKLSDYQSFIEKNPKYTLCFVNDGSTDDTLNVLKGFQKKLMSLHRGMETQLLIHDMPQNGGKAAAVRAGVNYLIENTNIQNVGFVDADLATGFDDYMNLVDTLENKKLDAVLGSRKLDAGLDMERSAFRQAASFAFGKFINGIIGLDIKDTQCGAKVFSRNIAQKVFKDSFQSKWLFDVEILIRIKNHFGKNRAMNFINEVALNKWEEVEGSKITFRDSIQFPIQLCQIAYDYNIRPQIQNISKTVNTAFETSSVA